MPITLRTRSLRAFLCVVVSVIVARPALARPAERPEVALPDGVLAYWTMDPSPFRRADAGPAPERALLLATLRAAVASGIAGSEQQARWVEGLLAAAMVGEVPHTLAVLEFGAHREPGAKQAEIDALQIVLELRTGRGHAEYLRTVRAILIDAANAKGLESDAAGAQRRLRLPGDRTGVAYRAADWPSWREVSWCSDGDRFVIALGEGALRAWFAEDARAEAPDERKPLRDAGRSAGVSALEAFLDLGALRTRFPEGFDEGRIERMLAALDLSGASALLVRASVVPSEVSPPLLVIDWITGRGGEVRAKELTREAWPAGLVLPVEGATYVALAEVDWPGLFDRVMEVHFATFRAAAAERERAKHEVWMERHGGRLDALLEDFSPWLALTDTPEPVLQVPGLGSVFVAAKPRVAAADLDSDLAALVTPFADQVIRGPDGVWFLKVDDAGLVRIPAWAFLSGPEHALLAGGWGPPVVEHARTVMENDERK